MSVARFWTITNPEILITRGGGSGKDKTKGGRGGGGDRGGGWTGRGGGGWGKGGGRYVSLNAETDTVIDEFDVAPNNVRHELMDILIGTLKTAGLWSTLDCLYLMAAHDEQASRVNWKSPGNFTLTNTGSGITFVVDSGFDFTGSGNLNTGWNLRNTSGNIAYNASCMGIWTGHTGQIGSPSAAMGCNPIGGSVSGILITPRKDDNTWITKLNGFNNFVPATGLGSGDDGGLWHISRNAGAVYNAFRNGVYDMTLSSTAKTPMVNDVIRIAGTYSNQYSVITKMRAAYWGGALFPGEDIAIHAALKVYMDDVVGGL